VRIDPAADTLSRFASFRLGSAAFNRSSWVGNAPVTTGGTLESTEDVRNAVEAIVAQGDATTAIATTAKVRSLILWIASQPGRVRAEPEGDDDWDDLLALIKDACSAVVFSAARFGEFFGKLPRAVLQRPSLRDAGLEQASLLFCGTVELWQLAEMLGSRSAGGYFVALQKAVAKLARDAFRQSEHVVADGIEDAVLVEVLPQRLQRSVDKGKVMEAVRQFRKGLPRFQRSDRRRLELRRRLAECVVKYCEGVERHWSLFLAGCSWLLGGSSVLASRRGDLDWEEWGVSCAGLEETFVELVKSSIAGMKQLLECWSEDGGGCNTRPMTLSLADWLRDVIVRSCSLLGALRKHSPGMFTGLGISEALLGLFQFSVIDWIPQMAGVCQQMAGDECAFHGAESFCKHTPAIEDAGFSQFMMTHAPPWLGSDHPPEYSSGTTAKTLELLVALVAWSLPDRLTEADFTKLTTHYLNWYRLSVFQAFSTPRHSSVSVGALSLLKNTNGVSLAAFSQCVARVSVAALLLRRLPRGAPRVRSIERVLNKLLAQTDPVQEMLTVLKEKGPTSRQLTLVLPVKDAADLVNEVLCVIAGDSTMEEKAESARKYEAKIKILRDSGISESDKQWRDADLEGPVAVLLWKRVSAFLAVLPGLSDEPSLARSCTDSIVDVMDAVAHVIRRRKSPVDIDVWQCIVERPEEGLLCIFGDAFIGTLLRLGDDGIRLFENAVSLLHTLLSKACAFERSEIRTLLVAPGAEVRAKLQNRALVGLNVTPQSTGANPVERFSATVCERDSAHLLRKSIGLLCRLTGDLNFCFPPGDLLDRGGPPFRSHQLSVAVACLGGPEETRQRIPPAIGALFATVFMDYNLAKLEASLVGGIPSAQHRGACDRLKASLALAKPLVEKLIRSASERVALEGTGDIDLTKLCSIALNLLTKAARLAMVSCRIGPDRKRLRKLLRVTCGFVRAFVIRDQEPRPVRDLVTEWAQANATAQSRLVQATTGAAEWAHWWRATFAPSEAAKGTAWRDRDSLLSELGCDPVDNTHSTYPAPPDPLDVIGSKSVAADVVDTSHAASFLDLLHPMFAACVGSQTS
jgi:hypothetical protein